MSRARGLWSGGSLEQSRPANAYSRPRPSRLTNLATVPPPGGPHGPAPFAPSWARASLIETLAYSCAFDLCGDAPKALSLARDLLKDVRKSGLKPPFSEALLRRLALAQWTKRDRPRPHRLESSDPKESTILLFFFSSWGATYGGTLVFDYGFNVETAGDSPVWHPSETDVLPGEH